MSLYIQSFFQSSTDKPVQSRAFDAHLGVQTVKENVTVSNVKSSNFVKTLHWETTVTEFCAVFPKKPQTSPIHRQIVVSGIRSEQEGHGFDPQLQQLVFSFFVSVSTGCPGFPKLQKHPRHDTWQLKLSRHAFYTTALPKKKKTARLKPLAKFRQNHQSLWQVPRFYLLSRTWN